MYSPTKVTPDQAYSMFVSALEVSRLAVVSKGNINQIVAMGELPPERGYSSINSKTPMRLTWPPS